MSEGKQLLCSFLSLREFSRLSELEKEPRKNPAMPPQNSSPSTVDTICKNSPIRLSWNQKLKSSPSRVGAILAW